MKPFVYENLIKGILSKSKYESKSRTYLTHMNPAGCNLAIEKPRSPRSPSKSPSKSLGIKEAKEKSERREQAVGAVKR